MKIIATGTLSEGVPGTSRAILTFPSVLALPDGGLLATIRAGSTKDGADEQVELYRSDDDGRSWQLQQHFTFDGLIDGAGGTLKVCYLTQVAPGRLIAAAMWVDRTTYPGLPLFNPATEGCLPMFILVATSEDSGATWTSWQVVSLPADIGPASLTSPILALSDGTLVMSIETNKHYDDATTWYQRVVLFHSTDGGQSWGAPSIAGQDPTGRIYNWDQRLGLAPDGRIGAFIWTYDSQEHTYLDIHRRISNDGGRSWSSADNLGFADQAGRPAILVDGRVILPWVDRFGTHAIRARMAAALDEAFDPATEVVLHALNKPESGDHGEATTGTMLADMALWTFGLPYAEVLPNGDVLIMYYAGSETAMDIHWARVQP